MSIDFYAFEEYFFAIFFQSNCRAVLLCLYNFDFINKVNHIVEYTKYLLYMIVDLYLCIVISLRLLIQNIFCIMFLEYNILDSHKATRYYSRL